MGNLSNIKYRPNHRNTDPEWMDDPNLDQVTLQHAVDDINTVNRLLNGFNFTLKAIKKELQKYPNKALTIVDAGCGDGEMLRFLEKNLKQENISFLGLDFAARSIEKARLKSEGLSRLRFRESDILKINPSDLKCDILISSLTMHHFDDNEIVTFLTKFKEITSKSIIINDLHRHKLAFLFFKYLSPIFIRHEISKHDGLISIASGFKVRDFKKYAKAIGVKNDRLTWKWSFRYIWIILV
ncbi:methyltransferase family protein [Nonlabens xylanidelens]|uniref:Methyltransferase family protein n=1 Tax=Nonlabens xylanidelens TaxID=191564 RepID=A0A2S6IMV5_9FLAO|nr:methyltransferase domain-containing protein [Nonlabens xylanidelens]PPK95521.1 methyltransferase family protein [Nonlabens xylanidelens]PQJ22333.1 SAM-dependent methyltransferase [Nonlabens xylanidelens]